jgi:hypothetical protein
MRDAAKTSLISLGSAVLAIGAYHLLRSSPADAPLDRDRQALEAEVASLRQDFDRFRKQLMADLDARVRAIANPPARPSATPPAPTARPGDGGGPVRPPTPPDADRVTEFRALLEAVEKQRLRERGEDTWRRRLKALGAPYSPSEEDTLVGLAARYQDDVRDAFPGGSAGNTPEERDSTMRKWRDLHAELVKRITDLLSPELAKETLKLFPEPGAEPTPRDVATPTPAQGAPGR